RPIAFDCVVVVTAASGAAVTFACLPPDDEQPASASTVAAAAITSVVRIAAYLTGVFYGAAQARIHHERFGNLARAASELVPDRLAAAGIGRGTVVDLGCGSGIYAAAMTAAGYDVVGCDLSPDMIELARA